MFRAVIFDIGRTLAGYQKPLNWSALYRQALEYACNVCGIAFTEQEYRWAESVLTRYNTRVNPREREVNSQQIFTELLSGTDAGMQKLDPMKHAFYTFFRQDAVVYPEAEETLRVLNKHGIQLATLSDVPYGMDNTYVLDDIAPLLPYIRYPLTSNDVGYRKPHTAGVRLLADLMQVKPGEILFVGDEEKDMVCARNAGACPVLINREKQERQFGQEKEISSLSELALILEITGGVGVYTGTPNAD